mmetsp:Transcript_90629/g.272195  ORF Transcript_90629/g.272195 Transcript_90629/m.272195 type:complete len:274 (+) Transcript_90629:1-822(+)
MTHNSHPRTLRVTYFKTWMAQWAPSDRECALAEAFMQVVNQIKGDMRDGARTKAIGEKEDGKVTFGEDGFGVMRRKAELEGALSKEGFELVSIVLEELTTTRSYEEPALFCSTIESCTDGREEDERWLPADRRKRLFALRPQYLFGEQAAAEHALRAWMCETMALSLRQQVLISVGIKVVMSAAGVISVQVNATHDLRNMRRKAKGLPLLAPGEDSEDDEILSKTDLEQYQESQFVGAQDAMQTMRGNVAAQKRSEMKKSLTEEKEGLEGVTV